MQLVLAVRNRSYKNKVHLRGLRENSEFEPTHHLGFACVAATSSRQGFFEKNHKLNYPITHD
ncbi:hypothetical protein VB711_18515 [Cronbergia sp. UHCC 0137]|uniref:hypothetical protein n=1 Tax=Cronbergia sp. UHCC 0137 TaxID=3110239 RepID=UPI002B1FF8B7|nr:hypothetical protein [Cronbergia sp. UHCC 0137]MEA5619821.1 hypothetical protein [Cronbergia sp. UHCC 0137]